MFGARNHRKGRPKFWNSRTYYDSRLARRHRILSNRLRCRFNNSLPLDAVASLNSGPQGLSSAEALRRLSEFGPNRVEEVAGESMLLRFLKEFTHFFALILWLAAALAFFAEWSDPGQGMAQDRLRRRRRDPGQRAVFVLAGIRVERTLAALRKLLPQQVDVLREGKAVRLPADQLVPGEIVLLEQGDNIPADCRLIEAFGVRVNNATVTGESLPKRRDAEPATQKDLIHAENILLAGTSMVPGKAKAVVFATGMHTEFGKIAHLAQTGGEAVSPLREQVAYLSRLIGILAVAIGLFFFAIGAIIGVPFWEGFIFAIGIIVAMVPEGLLPTLTLALVLATQRMAKRNVLIRYLPSVETLGSTTVICTDKTGTLTQNRMTVRQHLARSGRGIAAPNPGLEPSHRRALPAFLHDRPLVPRSEGRRAAGTDGTGSAIRWKSRWSRWPSASCPRFRLAGSSDEIPFDVEPHAAIDGACDTGGADALLQGRARDGAPAVRSNSGRRRNRPLDSGLRAKVHAAQEAMAAQGLRVLAMSYRPLGGAVAAAGR